MIESIGLGFETIGVLIILISQAIVVVRSWREGFTGQSGFMTCVRNLS